MTNQNGKAKKHRHQQAIEQSRGGRNSFVAKYVERSPFPVRMFRKLVYAYAGTLTSSATNFQCGTENVWRLNSCFDPDLTGGTHQPFGFDQMAQLYDSYLVRACKMDIVCTSAANSPVGVLAFQAQPATATTVLTGQSVSDIEEKTSASVLWLDSSGMVRKFSARFDIATLSGLTKEQQANDTENYAALVTTSPVSTPYLRMAYVTCTGASAVALVFRIRLEYEVEFFGRTILAASN